MMATSHALSVTSTSTYHRKMVLKRLSHCGTASSVLGGMPLPENEDTLEMALEGVVENDGDCFRARMVSALFWVKLSRLT